MELSTLEKELGASLFWLPSRYNYRYDDCARDELLRSLFHAMTGFKEDYFKILLPDGFPNGDLKLSAAQGGKDGAEYTEAARGKRCGHVFKAGEASYRCMTCSVDETCCLCSRCFEASDHTGHKHSVFISGGHSGCCDCGDEEAFRIPVNCAIHTDLRDSKGKERATPEVPSDLVESIRCTIGRAMDYVCDVISCSPEQLRLPKTEAGIRRDEVASRLSGEWYGSADREEEEPEFAVVLWNDEKHTINDVKNQVARACRERDRFGLERANETNDIGRSVLKYSKDLGSLLQISRKVEEIRVTVTIRSSRDTFREQMCGTILEWLCDIAGCHVMDDNMLLRQTICDQMLRPWRAGSGASNADIGRKGIDSHGLDDGPQFRGSIIGINIQARLVADVGAEIDDDDDDDDVVEDDDEEEEEEEEEEEPEDMYGDEGTDEIDEIDPVQLSLERIAANIDEGTTRDEDQDVDMRTDDDLEVAEATLAGYPPPPPPPPPAEAEGTAPVAADRSAPAASESTGDGSPARSLRNIKIPKTPGVKPKASSTKPSPYWEVKPSRYHERGVLPYEDIRQRTRLDWLILFDLRLWKKARNDQKELCLGTVVNVPEFKRVLGLRFAALYTALAQLYLVADREPDQSIINLSLQLLTTPSITEEVVERGNFLTNILAILHTFLTTRQVGESHDVNRFATLALDSGSITNRRLFHFFLDLRYLLPSEHVQKHVRADRQYLLQFLDLMKLPQGICPNVRAVGEHVEYETDNWIGASILMREINRLCRSFFEAFGPDKIVDDPGCLEKAMSVAALSTMIHSVGLERKRFDQAEIKDLVRYKAIPFTDFETEASGKPGRHLVVDFVVERGAISFHHPLHYSLSWLLECGRNMSREKMRDVLLHCAQLCKLKLFDSHLQSVDLDDIILAMFDFPLRVCAWLAQMKAGMWVRNGLSLRHQMGQYRSVVSRDMAYYRDIFMLQAAFVVCDPSQFLASVADRYGISEWMKGGFATRAEYDDGQHLDIAEEFIHLLIILITERSSLTPFDDEATIQRQITGADIAHTLCFKPLSFTEITGRISDKIVESDYFNDVLAEVAIFRPPDGLNDTGTFELKPEYIESVDPYCAQYTKNQRDEAENIYKQWMAKKTGKKPADVVFEPLLKSIPTGAFSQHTRFTQTPLFAHIVHRCLEYCVMYKIFTPNVTPTRVESLLHILLHLVLLATMEDKTAEDDPSRDPQLSFASHSMTKSRSCQAGNDMTILGLLQMASNVTSFESCLPKIRHILKLIKAKRPQAYGAATADSSLAGDEAGSASPSGELDNEADTRKKKALDRQARIMAQFQQQQQNFLNTQTDIDWGQEDQSEEEEPSSAGYTAKKRWDYPSGNCILCQEETNDSRIYGSFGFISESVILRQTDLKDRGYVREALNTPSSLDRPAEDIRPFGVASENREKVRRLDSTGGEVISEKQGLGRGFPSNEAISGPVTTGCGHIMHYSCFEVYYTATQRRHTNQVARSHPERLEFQEFVCPLCKALGNVFLPIIWNSKEESYPGVLEPQENFNDFLNENIIHSVGRSTSHAMMMGSDKLSSSGFQNLFVDYMREKMIPPLSNKITQLKSPNSEPLSFSQPPRMPMPGLFPSSDDVPALSPLHQVSTPDDSPVTELVSIYRRLRETLRTNEISSKFAYQASTIMPEDLIYTDCLVKSFGFSISAAEIAQRGIGSEPGKTLLDKVPQSSLTHLRILAETALSYAFVGGLHSTTRKTVHEFKEMHRRKLCQLLLGHPSIMGLVKAVRDNRSIEPLFSVDTFVFLAECSLVTLPVLNVDILHIIRICYVAEVLKSIYTFILRSQGLVGELNGDNADQDMEDAFKSEEPFAARRLFNWIVATHNASLPQGSNATERSTGDLINDECPPERILRSLSVIAGKYALPFLRKTVLLLHVQYGLEFPNTGSDYDGLSELDRLTALLRLPTVDKILESFGMGEEDNQLEALAAGWIAHWNLFRFDANKDENRSLVPSLSHPAIFELVGLPTYYDVLLDEANQRRCPTTGKELTDPSVCLFCGEIFCSQASCCRGTSGAGGCNSHVARCGKNVGLFINIRKCAVLVLHNKRGLWQHAPFLDIHGEVDMGYRHHRRLILNQKRYDRLLRDIWLSHAIPATVGRKLESEMNTGGWETL